MPSWLYDGSRSVGRSCRQRDDRCCPNFPGRLHRQQLISSVFQPCSLSCGQVLSMKFMKTFNPVVSQNLVWCPWFWHLLHHGSTVGLTSSSNLVGVHGSILFFSASAAALSFSWTGRESSSSSSGSPLGMLPVCAADGSRFSAFVARRSLLPR